MSRGRRATLARWLDLFGRWMRGRRAADAGAPAAEAGASQAAPRRVVLPPRPRSLRLLVAEDVLIFREILRAGLQRAGHVVVFADDGEQAVGLAARLRFDLVLLDLRMPVMDGLEAARRIRALAHGGAEVPILGLTTAPGAAEHAACAAAGMDACLAKPIDWDRLLAALLLHVAAAEANRRPAPRPGPTGRAAAAAYDGLAARQDGQPEGPPMHSDSNPASHAPAPVDLAAESVAGEEDPGASIDMAATPAAGGSAGLTGTGAPSPAPRAPGDQAPPGTPGTGENVCAACGGSGRQGAQACAQCQGTGKVTTGIGGA